MDSAPMVGPGGILGHLLSSLWLPSWHLETGYSANRQAGLDFFWSGTQALWMVASGPIAGPRGCWPAL